MKLVRLAAACVCLAPWLISGCHMPGKPTPQQEARRPEDVLSFTALYGQNCAGCHGEHGQNGAALALGNPEYQAIVDDATLRDTIANGEQGTLMPGFGTKSGGMLTDEQIDVIVRGLRGWGQANVLAGQNPPPYKETHAGDAAHGQQVYATACASCHGAQGAKPGPAGNVLDGSYLALINERTLRSILIAGRPDIGQPDWRNDVPGHPLSDADITDVTAWMIAQRPANPGQPYPSTRPNSQPAGEAQPTAPGPPHPGSNARQPISR